jgi:hypothetical protein
MVQKGWIGKISGISSLITNLGAAYYQILDLVSKLFLSFKALSKVVNNWTGLTAAKEPLAFPIPLAFSLNHRYTSIFIEGYRMVTFIKKMLPYGNKYTLFI